MLDSFVLNSGEGRKGEKNRLAGKVWEGLDFVDWNLNLGPSKGQYMARGKKKGITAGRKGGAKRGSPPRESRDLSKSSGTSEKTKNRQRTTTAGGCPGDPQSREKEEKFQKARLGEKPVGGGAKGGVISRHNRKQKKKQK